MTSKRRTSKPFYGYVWFDGGNMEQAAAIYGTTNGWAVCVMEWPDARNLLEDAGMKVTTKDDNLIAYEPSMNETFHLPIDKNGMTLFDGSFSLHHRRDDLFKISPSKLPIAWERRINFDH